MRLAPADPLEPEDLDVDSVLARVTGYFRARVPTLSHPVRIDLDTSGPLMVKGDPVLIEWAVEAIVKNAVDALAGWAGDDPGFDLVGQTVGDGGVLALGLFGHQSVQPAIAVSVEPTGNAAAVDGQIIGALLAGAALVRQQDNLKAVAEFAVVGGAEGLLKPLCLGFAQLDANHLDLPLVSPFLLSRM